MPPTAFESLFGVKLKGAYDTDEEIHVPTDLEHLIDQITISRPPEMFARTDSGSN
jgi:hypothetical protein